jgi:hypothetical protein
MDASPLDTATYLKANVTLIICKRKLFYDTYGSWESTLFRVSIVVVLNESVLKRSINVYCKSRTSEQLRTAHPDAVAKPRFTGDVPRNVERSEETRFMRATRLIAPIRDIYKTPINIVFELTVSLPSNICGSLVEHSFLATDDATEIKSFAWKL